ncbi:MAG: ribosomal protein S18-alanine N-acetyltransferase [Nitrospirae bacterium]|nr:ribosomal protein S18-alanine N-acetyltransferase [Nitrospirota bacterium]
MPIDTVTISNMDSSDIPRVIEIEDMSFTHRWTLTAYVAELSNPGSICRTAHLGGMVVGFICVRIMVDEAHILRLAVDPAHRRGHVGSLLVRYIIDEALKDFDGKIILEVRVSNISAARLYESLGFKKSYVRRCYYNEPDEDAVVMAYDLSSRA